MLKTESSIENVRFDRKIWIALGALVVIVCSFAAYYYFDRYSAPAGAPKASDPIAQLEEKVRTKPNDADLRITLAENYLLNRRYEDAISQAGDVLKASPKKDRAMLILGVASALDGQASQALAPLGDYIAIHAKLPGAELDSGLQAALYYQADSYLKLDRPADAVKSAGRAVSISPTDADALYLLGKAYAATGSHKNALKVLQVAVAFVPDYSEAYQAMATSYEATKQPVAAAYAGAMVDFSAKEYEKARDELLQVISKQKDFGPALLGLGLVYEQLGDLKNARADLQLAVKQMPQSVAAQQALGRVKATQQQEQ